MENRKSYVLTAAIAIAVGLFFIAQPAVAYEVDTHMYLTKESIELYNKHTGENKISSDLQRFIIDGSAHEDDLPRPENHFYDPINNKGLDDSIYSGQSAKEWANDINNQKKIGYVLFSDSSLSLTDWEKVKSFYPASNFTWNAALKYWLKGDKEMAMEALGHVLHLVEDMGVPEHTRNDSHSRGSKYEEYAGRYRAETPDGQFKARLGNKKPFVLDSIDEYFDGLAKYSNKYFYSTGSLGNYDFPELDYKNAESKENIYYLANKDDEGTKYYIATKQNIANIALGYLDVSVTDDPIKESYWSLLSVRTVRYSAGVIDLFFKDVEKARQDPDFLKEEIPSPSIVARASNIVSSIWTGTKDIAAKTGTFFSNVFKAVGNGVVSSAKFVGGLFTSDNGLTDAGSVDVASDATNDSLDTASEPATKKTTATKQTASTKLKEENAALKLQIAGLQKESQIQDATVLQLEKKQTIAVAADATSTEQIKDITTKKVSSPAPLCTYGSINRTAQKEIVINEVAWMGSVRSASDEWIELKNVSGSDVDVSGWQLLNKGGGVKIQLSKLSNPIIKPGQFVLLERTDNNSAVGATASLIYSGAIGNSNDGLKLFNDSCGIVDEVPVATHWPAGSNDSKQTMERNLTGSGWHTSTNAGGTPKKENSTGVVYSGGGGGSVVASNSTSRTQDSGSEAGMTAKQIYPKLLINKIQLASASSTHDEFVELYNPNDAAVDLTGWYVQKKTKAASDFSTFAKADLFAAKQIASHGVFTIAHPSSTAAYDVASDYGIADDNTLVLKNPNGDIVDKAGWGEAGDCEGACAVSPEAGRYIQRNIVNNVAVDTDDNAHDFTVSVLMEDATATATTTDEILKQVQDDNLTGATTTATTTEQTQDSGSEAGMTQNSTSTILWDGGAQAGKVYDLNTEGYVGQRVSFSSGVDVGLLQFGYYNDLAAGSVEAGIFASDGATKWATTLAVPRISYGGYVEYTFTEPLHLAAGDYFVGSRLISGAIGIRKGYGVNSCGNAVYASGNIPSCDDGDDVSMVIGRFVASVAATTSTTTATSTEQILDSGPSANGAGMTDIAYLVVINEIMYDLPGSDENREWIEVYNAGTTTADIADWKFYENETHHGLTVKQGNSGIPAGGYAVIANDGVKFLEDNVGFDGALFDSAFSLSNDGETLALKNGDLVIDTTAYASSTGANGDGMSLQKFSDGWHAASSTPGKENVMQVVTIDGGATSTDPITDVATTTEATATTTEGVTPQPFLPVQLDDTARSTTNRTSTIYQDFVVHATSTVQSFRIAVQGVAGRWKGGICAFNRGQAKCATSGLWKRTDADVDVPDSNTKTMLTFVFPSDISLNPDTSYALFVEPTPWVAMKDRLASVYGSATNAYPDGALYGSGQDDWGINGPLGMGIADMYFDIR